MALKQPRHTFWGVAFSACLLGFLLFSSERVVAHAEHASEAGSPQVSAKSPIPAGVSLVVSKGTGFQFLLSTDGQRVVEVLADDDKPFIKVDRSTVQANISSVAWHRAQQPGGGAVPPAVKSGKLPEQWVTIQKEAGLGWFDPRLNNEEVHSFVLKLRADKKVWPIKIERKADAVLSGFWQPIVADEPELNDLSVLVPGLSGNAIMMTRANTSEAPLRVLDDKKNPFLMLNNDGIWLDTLHPWVPELGLFPPVATTGERWVRLSGSSTVTYTDPRLKASAKANRKKPAEWIIPIQRGEEKQPGSIKGKLIWRSTAKQ